MPTKSAPAPIREPKLAQRVALSLEKEVMRRGWKVGEKLGSEATLTAKYGVSRWTMREAISIAERDGLVEFRRGQRGGVMIAAPALDVVGSAIRSYLGSAQVSMDELTEARMILEGLAARRAAERLDEATMARLRAVAAEAAAVGVEQSLEMAYSMLRELLLAAGNPALRVFAYALSQVTSDLALQRGVTEAALRRAALELIKTRSRQIDAIVGGDAVAARQIGAEHLARANRLVTTAPRGRPPVRLLTMPKILNGTSVREAEPKRAELISDELQAQLIRERWPVGKHLGTEAELMARFQVSRSVLREAIRPLERIGVLSMQLGRYPGLKVAQPDPGAVIRSTVLYLKYFQLDLSSAFELQSELELAAMAALTHLPKDAHPQAVDALRQVVARPRQPTVEAADRCIRELYFALARVTQNPIVSMFLQVLSGTMVLQPRSARNKRQLTENIERVRQGQVILIDAIEARDEPLARRRMMELRRIILETFDVAPRAAEDLVESELAVA